MALPPQAEISLLIRHSARMASVNEAWRYLINEAPQMSQSVNVEPYEIIMSEFYSNG